MYLKKKRMNILFLAISISQIHSQIINIPQDYNTIQEGINASSAGDTVLVDEGEYFENIDFKGKNIVVASRYIVDRNVAHIYNTIINGSRSAIKDNGSCVSFLSGEDSTAVIMGFTLTGGTGTTYVFGGGAAKFKEGGSIILSNSSATIKNNLIRDNESKVIPGVQGGGGGGISSMYGNPRILNNVIIRNTATYAAGVVLNWSGGTIKNNVIAENYGGGQYGTAGLMIWNSEPWSVVVENNTIVDNHSTSVAGGISIEQTSAILRNNIVWGNTQSSGKQITGYSSSIIEYCDAEELYNGTGNFSEMPNFLDNGYMLNQNSSCVDAGNPDIQFNDIGNTSQTGTALFPSLGTLRNDVGAYGGPGAVFLPDSSSLINGLDEKKSELPKLNFLLQNFPNPFNPSTEIKYSVSKRVFVDLNIFDVLGSKVINLVNEEKSIGDYEVSFNGKQLPSGIYIASLTLGGDNFTKKMCLLK